MAKKPPRKPNPKKSKKNPLRVDSDDIIDLAETLLDEATPVGLIKRSAQKIRLKIAAEFIEKVEKLTKKNDDLVNTINEMSETSAVIVDLVKKQDAEIRDLKAKLQKLRKKKKIAPKQ